MKMFFTELLNPGEIHFSVLAALLFMLPLNKKERFPTRFCTAGIPLILLGTGIVLLRRDLIRILNWGYLWDIPGEMVIFSVLTPLILIALIAGMFCFCCHIRWKDALYGAFCVNLTQYLAYSIFEMLLPNASHRASRPLVPETFWIECLITAFIFCLSYFFLAKRLPRNGSYPAGNTRALPLLVLILVMGRAVGLITEHAYVLESSYLFQLIQLHDILLTATLLVTQILQRQKADLEESIAVNMQIQQLQQREYQLFRRNTDSLNHRLHDLRHLLGAMKYENQASYSKEMQKLRDYIAVYDCAISTGNEALDALLIDAALRCQSHNIQWTCYADGAALSFLSPTDLYVIFGNALDNAIESALREPDTSRRFLFVNIWRKAQFVFVKIENSCPQSVTFENGLPQTTKEEPELHGFGTKSIRNVCSRYHGECSMSVHDSTFSLDLVFPIPHSGH